MKLSVTKSEKIASVIKEQENNTLSYARTKGKSISAKTMLSYCAVNGYMPYMGSSRRGNSLPKEEQLRKIALAQQKRERKALRKIK